MSDMRAIALLFTLAAIPGAAEPVTVDLELVLAVDVSRSMSHRDLATERRGYAEALTSGAVLEAIAAGPNGRIGLAYVEWSDVTRQRVLIDWRLIAGRSDAEAVAARLIAETGGTLRETSISGGLTFAAAMFETSPFSAPRRVIDISGDGPNNNGAPVTLARDQVVARGITINGLPLMVGNEYDIWHIDDLDLYYRDCVIGGPGAFVVPVRGWEAFPEAIRRKLILEIAGRAPAARVQKAQARRAPDCLIGEAMLKRYRRGND